MKSSVSIINNLEVITIENSHLTCSIVPALGGKISSLFNISLQKEFLWKNESLEIKQPDEGADYDSNFIGGIDELLPNDMPETIDGITYPDHGELWTTALAYTLTKNSVILYAQLTKSQLFYQKTITLNPNESSIQLDYTITNNAGSERSFLWKLHAALTIEKGDRLISTATKAKVVDPAYSRFRHTEEFNWPVIENTDAAVIPEKNGTMDFFFLYQNSLAEMSLLSIKDHSLFSFQYDKKVFPYQWYFASYGGFLNHYTAILEPCTSMPMLVNEAKYLQQCTVLQPGEELHTTVKIFAGVQPINTIS